MTLRSRRGLFSLAVAALCALLAGTPLTAPAWAQSTPVFQSGALTRAGNIAKMTRNGQITDGASAGILGNTSGVGVNPFAVTDSNALAVCANNAATSGSYDALCFGHDSSGNPIITSTNPLKINGTPWPGSVTTVRGASPTHFYVAKPLDGGSDSNTCLSALTACETIRRAVAVALGYDSLGHYLIVHIGAGTYREPIEFGGVVTGSGTYPGNSSSLGGVLYLLGTDGSAVTSIAVTTGTGCSYFGQGVAAFNGMVIALQGLTISTTCAGGSALDAESGSFIETVDDVVLGPANTCHAKTENGGIISFVDAGVTVKGNSLAVMCAGTGSKIELQPNATLTCSGAMAITNGFVTAQGNSGVTFGSGSSTSGCGSVTGPQWDLTGNSILEAQSSSSKDFIPGDVRGFIHSGGRYVPISPTAPALSSCGTSPAITGGDDSGVITIGGGTVTACTLTYAYPTQSIRYCTASSDSTALAIAFSTQNATAFTLATASTMAGATVRYSCRYPT